MGQINLWHIAVSIVERAEMAEESSHETTPVRPVINLPDPRAAGTDGVDRAPLFLTYHEISSAASPYLYQLTDMRFCEHLRLLHSLSATCATAPAVVTFDDGHHTNFDQAFPLLQQSGLNAIFFVLPQFLGSSKYISWQQAREMTAAGHQIQSHGWSHRLLPRCSPHALREELVRSKRELEDRLGIEVTSLSAPGGRWDERVVRAAAEAGYRSFFHSNPWARSRMILGVHVRGRLMVTDNMEARALQKSIQVAGMQRTLLRGKYFAKEKLRRLLGDRLYHKLWCWLSNFDSQDSQETFEVQVD